MELNVACISINDVHNAGAREKNNILEREGGE